MIVFKEADYKGKSLQPGRPTEDMVALIQGWNDILGLMYVHARRDRRETRCISLRQVASLGNCPIHGKKESLSMVLPDVWNPRSRVLEPGSSRVLEAGIGFQGNNVRHVKFNETRNIKNQLERFDSYEHRL